MILSELMSTSNPPRWSIVNWNLSRSCSGSEKSVWLLFENDQNSKCWILNRELLWYRYGLFSWRRTFRSKTVPRGCREGRPCDIGALSTLWPQILRRWLFAETTTARPPRSPSATSARPKWGDSPGTGTVCACACVRGNRHACNLVRFCDGHDWRTAIKEGWPKMSVSHLLGPHGRLAPEDTTGRAWVGEGRGEWVGEWEGGWASGWVSEWVRESVGEGVG